MESPIYDQQGKKVDTVKLPDAIFAARWNADLVHQVVVGAAANRRRNTAKVKDRGEVRGGGRKPWQQKGTGRARHGSIRSPLWRGGGATHGPSPERNYDQKVNKKMKRSALKMVLSQKLRDQEILWLSSLALDQPKTKLARAVIDRLSAIGGFNQLKFAKGHRALIAIPKPDATLNRSFRNLPQVAVEEVRNLNPELLLRYQYAVLVAPSKALSTLTAITS